MKGMGKYKVVEDKLAKLSIDEINELYLSGELDNIYDDFDRVGKVEFKESRKEKGQKQRVKESL